MKKIGVFVAAAALIASPLMAQGVPVIAPLSGDESAQGESGGGGIIAAVMGAGLAAMIVLAATDGSDVPVSG